MVRFWGASVANSLELSASGHLRVKTSTSALTNSAVSPRSNRATPSQIAGVCTGLGLLVFLAAWWCFRNGYVLYYGDAEAHLNISRGLIDSRTPGYDQLGTVWLPVLHVICVPFVSNNFLWSTGLAGTIPVAFCFVVAGLCFFLTAKEVYGSSAAAIVVVACFALNPNVLYLASIPMTELVFLAGLGLMMFALFRFRRTQSTYLLALALAASWWMSLTRYDGWFLIPFASLGFALFAKRNRLLILIVFGALAALAPESWMAYNWWEKSNALDFFNGPYSAAAIQKGAWYPGYHDWFLAVRYYSAASRLCAGWSLLLLGVAGLVCATKRQLLLPCAFLLLTPAFYVWSMHSSASPIHVPQLWPFSYYNTRYGIAVVAAAAFATGAFALVLEERLGKRVLLIPVLSLVPWLLQPSKEAWICWKESEVNSLSRRDWTAQGAQFFAEYYQPGSGILASAGDVTGVFCRSGLPLRETLNIGNGPAWLAATSRPDLVHQELWAVAQEGDELSKQLQRPGSAYAVIDEIKVAKAPALNIYRRHLK